MDQIPMIKQVILRGLCRSKKCIHHFTAAPFPMIVCGKSAVWATAQHMTDPEVVITQFGHHVKLVSQPGAVPGGLVGTAFGR